MLSDCSRLVDFILGFTAHHVASDPFSPALCRFVVEAYLTLPSPDRWAGLLPLDGTRLERHVAFSRAVAFQGLNAVSSRTGVVLFQKLGEAAPGPRVTEMRHGSESRFPWGLAMPACPFCSGGVEADRQRNGMIHFCCRSCGARAPAACPANVQEMQMASIAPSNFVWDFPHSPHPTLEWSRVIPRGNGEDTTKRVKESKEADWIERQISTT